MARVFESESSMGIVVGDDGDTRPVPSADDGRLLPGNRVKLQSVGYIQLGNGVATGLQLDHVLWQSKLQKAQFLERIHLGKR